jgi:LysM repeat protein
MQKRRVPSIKKAVTKFIFFVSVIIFILSLTHEQWMDSITNDKNAEQINTTNLNEGSRLDNKTASENQEDESEDEDSAPTTSDTSDEVESVTSENKEAVEGEAEENGEVEEQATNDESNTESDNNDVKTVIHTVKENETLYKISMKYYGSREGEEIIQKHNNLKDKTIYIGQKLEIPTNN